MVLQHPVPFGAQLRLRRARWMLAAPPSSSGLAGTSAATFGGAASPCFGATSALPSFGIFSCWCCKPFGAPADLNEPGRYTFSGSEWINIGTPSVVVYLDHQLPLQHQLDSEQHQLPPSSVDSPVTSASPSLFPRQSLLWAALHFHLRLQGQRLHFPLLASILQQGLFNTTTRAPTHRPLGQPKPLLHSSVVHQQFLKQQQLVFGITLSTSDKCWNGGIGSSSQSLSLGTTGVAPPAGGSQPRLS